VKTKGPRCRSRVKTASTLGVPERCGMQSSWISENRRAAVGRARFALFTFRDPGDLVTRGRDIEGVPVRARRSGVPSNGGDLIHSGGGDPIHSGGGDPITSSGGGGVISGGGGGVTSGSPFRLRAAAVGPALSVPDPSMRRTDLMALHPVFRDAVTELLNAFQTEGLPFHLFEAFRSPVRQAWLFRQGQRGGPIVTKADAWQSYHQYGLAADFVLWINGQWSWSTLGLNDSRWKRLHELGAKFGLENINSEKPHLQVAGLILEDLQQGRFPSGGDDLWRDNLEGAIISWTGKPAAPPMLGIRPELPQK
jgi:hypothetical protein